MILAFAAAAIQLSGLQSLSTADLTSICALSARETLRRGMGGHSPIALNFRLDFVDSGVGLSINKAVHDRLREWKSQLAPVGVGQGVSWLTIRILDRTIGRVVVRAEAGDTQDIRVFSVRRDKSGWELAKVGHGFTTEEAEQVLISASTLLSRTLHPQRPLFVAMDTQTRSLEFAPQSPNGVPASILNALRGHGFKPRTDTDIIRGPNRPLAYDAMELTWPHRLDDYHGYVLGGTTTSENEVDGGFKAFETAEWGVLVTKRGNRWVASESYCLYSE